MELMIGFAGVGLVLLIGAPALARLVVGREGDPGGLTRIFQGIAVILLLVALLVRPHQEETAAFPPPPDMTEER